MNQKAHPLKRSDAEWRITLGWSAGIVLTALKLIALVLVLLSDSEASAALIAQLAIEAALAATLTYGIYRRRYGAALGAFALWAVGFAWNWVLSGRLLPPLGLIGILIGIGLYQSIRGTRTFHNVAKSDAHAV